jgi:hypothetical protein
MMRIVLLCVVGLLVVASASAGESRPEAPAAGVGGISGNLAAAARTILGTGQGVYVEAANGQVLLAQAEAAPVHPASVSKVPTTLALLRKLGPEYRFVTTISTDGQVVGDMLDGDLFVEGGGDPSLVDEDALLIADRMIEMGIRQVAGELKVYGQGQLIFDWQPDADGARLRSALAGAISPGALATVRAFELERASGTAPSPSTLQPQGIRFGLAAVASSSHLVGTRMTGSTAAQPRVLITHHSSLTALAVAGQVTERLLQQYLQAPRGPGRGCCGG